MDLIDCVEGLQGCDASPAELRARTPPPTAACKPARSMCYKRTFLRLQRAHIGDIDVGSAANEAILSERRTTTRRRPRCTHRNSVHWARNHRDGRIAKEKRMKRQHACVDEERSAPISACLGPPRRYRLYPT